MMKRRFGSVPKTTIYRMGQMKSRIALMAGLFALVAVAGDQAWAAAPEAPQPAESQPDLVSYFVGWDATEKGTYSDFRFTGTLSDPQRSSDTTTERLDVETKGSAIVRFRQDNGYFYDMQFLGVTFRENYDFWLNRWDRNLGDCLNHYSTTISNPAAYSGLHSTKNSLIGGMDPAKEHRNVIDDPLNFLSNLRFVRHDTFHNSCFPQSDHTIDSERAAPAPFKEDVHRPIMAADSPDLSSFSMKAHFSVANDSYESYSDHPWSRTVVGTAHVYRMGKCSEHASPIPDGDHVIDHETVDMNADNPQIEPDGTTKLHLKVTCDQVPIEGAKIEVEAKPEENSGGHHHQADRPHGVINGQALSDSHPTLTVTTDAKGGAEIKFDPPVKIAKDKNVGIAGVYEVKAKSVQFPESIATAPISVEIDGLNELLASPDAYYEVHGATATHPDGFNGTPGTLGAFQALAKDFSDAQNRHNLLLNQCKNKLTWKTRKVSYNDIALPTGGLFDWKATWLYPHQTHGRGQGGDVNHFYETGSVTDCDNNCKCKSVNFDSWLTHTLFSLAEPKYGHWDQSDLKQSPPMWHLHVED